MNKVKIVADSTCDLSPELLQRYQVDIVPLYVNLNQETYRDGIDIVPDQIYAWVEEHKTTPKTAAITQVDVAAVFQKYVSQGYQVFYTGISGDMSASYQIAKLAASDFPENSIAVLDSRNLSTGIGHTVIRAAELAEAGMSCMRSKKNWRRTLFQRFAPALWWIPLHIFIAAAGVRQSRPSGPPL